jgi:hypothetical protein
MDRVFAKALALDPRERYADAGMFWNELLKYSGITSGEMQEVRMPRDARAEPGGGVRVERLELPRRASGRPPTPAPFAASALGARPTLDAPLGSAAAPVLRPLSPSSVPIAPTVSGSFEVPDLELAPVSRPSPPRTSSGLHRAVAPPLDLDEQALDLVPAPSLDLDLRDSDPLIRRASSAGMSAVRPSNPPPSFAGARVSSAPPGYSPSPPAVAVSSPLAPRPSAPPPAAPPVAVPIAPVKPSFEVKLGPEAEATLLERLLPGLVILGGAVLVTILDQIYTAIAGSVFELFGLRTSVLAGLMMLVGIALCLYRLKRD